MLQKKLDDPLHTLFLETRQILTLPSTNEEQHHSFGNNLDHSVRENYWNNRVEQSMSNLTKLDNIRTGDNDEHGKYF